MRRILVIDDDPGISFMVKVALEETGEYEVREENTATGALEAAREFRPDLALIDVMMPDLDGGDVAALLKNDRVLKETPVIFMTAAVLPDETAAKGGMIGGHPFIAKPLRTEALISIIEQNVRP